MNVTVHALLEEADFLRQKGRHLVIRGEELEKDGRYVAALDGGEVFTELSSELFRLAEKLAEEGEGLGRCASVLEAAAGIYSAKEKKAALSGGEGAAAVRTCPLDDVRRIVEQYTRISTEAPSAADSGVLTELFPAGRKEVSPDAETPDGDAPGTGGEA